MFVTEYLTPSHRRMHWEKRGDTSNALLTKAMSKNTFCKVMRFTHFSNSDYPKEDPFWKVSLLIKTLNETAAKFVEKTEYVSVDESMIHYFGTPSQAFHKRKTQEIRVQDLGNVYSTWPANSLRPLCRKKKTNIFRYGLSQGPDVVHGLGQKAEIVSDSKFVCDNLFTSLDLIFPRKE